MTQSIANLIQYFIVATSSEGKSVEHRMESGRSLFVGASSNCAVQVSGNDVANIHCLMDLNEGVISIQDWASPHGTFVNGNQIDSSTPVSEQDRIQIGGATIMIRQQQSSVARTEPSAVATVDQDNQDQTTQLAPEFDQDGDTAERLDSQIAGLKRTIATIEPIGDDACESECQIDDLELITHGEQLTDTDADDAETSDEAAVADSPWLAAPDAATATGSMSADFAEPMQYDQETIDLLKAELDDLRSMVADRDTQIEELSLSGDAASPRINPDDANSDALQRRIEELLAEAAENDERFAIVHDLMESAEIKNQAEMEERQALEGWVGEIEHRIGQRESEWKAQLETAQQRSQQSAQERDKLQHQLREVASRFGAQDVYRETLDTLQAHNAKLQDDLATTRKQSASLKQQLENIRNRELEATQHERAVIAKERADVSRLRFELSRKLTELETMAEPKSEADQEAALRLETLRSHLKEIHEQEQTERGQKGDTLFTRISGLWKRMDYEY